jgi:hypothetical protein
MARSTRLDGASKPFAWTTIFYLLLVFIAPLALVGKAHASEESVQESYGPSKCDSNFILFLRLELTHSCYSHWY